MAQKNHYETLGVSPTDSEETIRSAYRSLAKKYHPDLNTSDEDAQAKMGAISEAWDVLGDKGKREKYDAELSAKETKPFAPIANAVPKRPVTQEDFSRMTQSFEDMLSPGAIRTSITQRDQNPGSANTAQLFEQALNAKKQEKRKGKE